MKTNELLELDLTTMIRIRHTRKEAEVLANRVVGLIAEMAEDIATKILIEHCSTFDHEYKEQY